MAMQSVPMNFLDETLQWSCSSARKCSLLYWLNYQVNKDTEHNSKYTEKNEFFVFFSEP
jgi:hypothetical protein